MNVSPHQGYNNLGTIMESFQDAKSLNYYQKKKC